MTPTVVRLTAENPGLAKLLPYAMERIEAHAKAYQPETNAGEYARAYTARVVAGDLRVLLLGLVDPETAMLVGHVLAERVDIGTAADVVISQVRADENVGDALVQAVEQAIKWAHGQQVTRVLMHTHRDGREWVKRLGFIRFRTVLRLPLDDDADAGERSA